MADFIYDSLLTDLSSADFDFAADSFRMMLVGAGYVANQATHDRRNDVTNEITGTGYTATGTPITCSPSTAARQRILTFSAPSWPTATFSTAGGVIYKYRGGASSADELICYLDFGGTVSSSGGTFSVSATVLTITNA